MILLDILWDNENHFNVPFNANLKVNQDVAKLITIIYRLNSISNCMKEKVCLLKKIVWVIFLNYAKKYRFKNVKSCWKKKEDKYEI